MADVYLNLQCWWIHLADGSVQFSWSSDFVHDVSGGWLNAYRDVDELKSMKFKTKRFNRLNIICKLVLLFIRMNVIYTFIFKKILMIRTGNQPKLSKLNYIFPFFHVIFFTYAKHREHTYTCTKFLSFLPFFRCKSTNRRVIIIISFSQRNDPATIWYEKRDDTRRKRGIFSQ